jgi:hypothetical protein
MKSANHRINIRRRTIAIERKRFPNLRGKVEKDLSTIVALPDSRYAPPPVESEFHPSRISSPASAEKIFAADAGIPPCFAFVQMQGILSATGRFALPNTGEPA